MTALGLRFVVPLAPAMEEVTLCLRKGAETEAAHQWKLGDSLFVELFGGVEAWVQVPSNDRASPTASSTRGSVAPGKRKSAHAPIAAAGASSELSSIPPQAREKPDHYIPNSEVQAAVRGLLFSPVRGPIIV